MAAGGEGVAKGELNMNTIPAFASSSTAKRPILFKE